MTAEKPKNTSRRGPQLVVLGGPDGAGKTTYYEVFLKTLGGPFVNADRLAARTGIGVEEAIRAAGAVRRVYLRQGVSFVAETMVTETWAARLRLMREAVKAGYEVHLVQVALASLAVAKARVAARPKVWGKPVAPARPTTTAKAMAHLGTAIGLAATVRLYNNSFREKPFQLVAEFRAGKRVEDLATNPGAASLAGTNELES